MVINKISEAENNQNLEKTHETRLNTRKMKTRMNRM